MSSTTGSAAALRPFHQPFREEYGAAASSFNLLTKLQPSAAVTATSISEVMAAVATARRLDLGISVITTGHGAGRLPSLNGSLLLRVVLDSHVSIDPERRTATIPAGARWGDVVSSAAIHGLAASHGSSASVGAVGYLLSGGLSFYGRLQGVASNALRSVTVVTADGTLIRADSQTEPQLLWALRGGGGGFGVVVEVEIELFPIWKVLTGFTAWDAKDSDRIAPIWHEWTQTAPREVTTSLRLMHLPPVPQIPDELKNGQILMLDGAVSLESRDDLREGSAMAAALLAPLREEVEPLIDTWHLGTAVDLLATHLDPPEPMPYFSDHFIIDKLDDKAMGLWLSAAGAESHSVLTSAELRQLGGAFADSGKDGGALNRVGGEMAVFNIGVPSGLATEDLVRAQQARIRETLARYDTGFTAPTFVEDPAALHRAFPAEIEAQVEAIRDRVDPHGMFARDAVRATIQ